jgi:hypothetical protein
MVLKARDYGFIGHKLKELISSSISRVILKDYIANKKRKLERLKSRLKL